MIDREHKAVTVDYKGMDVPRLAVMLDGLGTVLMPIGATLEDRAMLPEVDVPMPEGDPAQIDWPDGDRLPTTPLPAEIDTALLNKIGMRHTFPEIDPYGNFILSSQMWTTARDLARFGLLYLHDGVWNGERILPEGWVDYTVQKAPMRIQETERARGYGVQFWLLGDDPRVPAGTYTTSGARGQLSTIVPSHNLVVTRTGLDPAGSNWDQAELVADVVKAIRAH